MARSKTKSRSKRVKGSKSRKGQRGRKSSRKSSRKGGRNNSLFKNYLSNLRNNLNGGTSNLFDQDGGGYSMNVNDAFNNQPVVTSYPDCCPPAIVDGQLVQSDGDSPVCAPNLYGGSKKRSPRKTGKKTRRSKKSKKKTRGGKRKSSKRKRTRSKKTKRKSRKSSKKSSKKRKITQLGGMDAEYPSSVSGSEGNFSADMTTRQFGCSQPNWEANCV